MNYIGSKVKLLPFIASTIREVTGGDTTEFADIFAGTGVVGAYFRNMGAKVISNDLQFYSYVLNKHLIEGTDYKFDKLEFNLDKAMLFSDKLVEVENYIDRVQTAEGFVYNNYSSGGTRHLDTSRMYFTDENARKCDGIRLFLEKLYVESKISDAEYYYLLSSLLYSVDKVANTASVYGAFLKKIKKSAQKSLSFRLAKSSCGEHKGKVFNMDANALIKDIEGEVLYLDPPYNHRQYAANYHMLETIARYDNPQIKGVSGLRDYNHQKSNYCMRNEAEGSLAELIENARFKYVFLSYNNEGIIPMDSIEKIMKSRGEYMRISKEYQRYKADSNREYRDDKTYEYLHILKMK